MRRLIVRMLAVAGLAFMGVGFGEIGVLLIGLIHPLSSPLQIIVIGLGAAFWGWVRMWGAPYDEAPRRGAHGSARLAGADEVRRELNAAHGLIVGRENLKNGALLRYSGPAHLITIAPTRSGKGAGAVIPNLLFVPRSVLVIDPKGENARVAARARERFGPVYVLDPFGISGRPSAAFNPLAELDLHSLDLAEGRGGAGRRPSPGRAWTSRRRALERRGEGADRRRHAPRDLLRTSRAEDFKHRAATPHPIASVLPGGACHHVR